jgi:hypothetical protein
MVRARTRIVVLLVVCVGIAATAAAQSAEAPPTVSGYAVAGPAGYSAFFGSRSGIWSVAGGADIVSRAGVGVAGELGLFFDHTGNLFFTPSIDGVFQLRRSGARVTPFLAAGYTRLLGVESSFDGWNVGGGFTWWSSGRTGFRIELRDHIRADRTRRAHYWAFRAGVAFR